MCGRLPNQSPTRRRSTREECRDASKSGLRKALSMTVLAAHKVEKRAMDAWVVTEFRMEGGSHGFVLAYCDRVVPFRGQDLYARPQGLYFGSANEDHLQRRSAKRPLADGAIDLPAVGVAADADIECAQSGLVGIGDFFGEHDRARAGAEGGLQANELLQLFESFWAKNLQERARFAARDYEAVDFVKLLGLAHKRNVGAQLLEAFLVSVKVALDGENTNGHKRLSALSYQPSVVRTLRPLPEFRADD